jgi:hypothetical protein
MDIEEYIAHLLSSPSGNSCVKAGEVLQVSHDQITRLLNNSTYSGTDLFAKSAPQLVLEGGTLTLDDSVIDKPYSDLDANDLVAFHWSGKHHKSVRGICLVVLLYTDITGHSLPVNFRIFDPNAGLSKHELLQQMVREVIRWGIRPVRFTADSWYASLENLKFLRNLEISFQIGLKSNRTVSPQAGIYEQVGAIENIPADGVITHLKGFDFIKVFRTVDPNGDVRHYAVYEPETKDLQRYDRQQFKTVKEQHWQVEQLFRIVKQVCHLESFFVRKAQAVINHVYGALRAFQRLAAWSKNQIISSIYALRKTIFLNTQRNFIRDVVA